MAKHVHIHVHTDDSEKWDESKHPRKDDGKFGTGSGGGAGSEKGKGDLAELLKRNPQLAKLRAAAVEADAAVDKAETLEEKMELKRKAERASRAYSQAKADARAGEERAGKQVSKEEKEYRGRESGPAEGSKGESDLVKAGGPVSKETEAAAAAHKEPAQKKQGVTRAELRAQAKAELAAANKGDGSFHRAAELYEQAGDKEKAEGSRALALRYGHDPESVAKRKRDDAQNAADRRAEAERHEGKVKELLLREADLHERMSKEDAPRGSVATAKELRAVQNEVAYEMSQAKKKD